MTHVIIFFFWGGAVFSQTFIWQYIKKHSTNSHGRYDLDLWEKSKLRYEARPYLANLRISKHSQDKS